MECKNTIINFTKHAKRKLYSLFQPIKTIANAYETPIKFLEALERDWEGKPNNIYSSFSVDILAALT